MVNINIKTKNGSVLSTTIVSNILTDTENNNETTVLDQINQLVDWHEVIYYRIYLDIMVSTINI